MSEDFNLLEPDLLVDNPSRLHLREIITWSKFLGVIGFAYSIVLVAAAFYAVFKLLGMSPGGGAAGERLIAGSSVGIIYLVFGGIVFLMSFYLFRFSNKMQAAVVANDQTSFTRALKNLRVFFRFAGILTVVVMVFSLLALMGIWVSSLL